MPAGDTLFSEQTAPLLFPTNRFNLLEILSNRMIAPRPAYQKYYADLLTDAPGRVPLVSGPLGPDVVAAVSAETPSAFPVAVELEPRALRPVAVDARGATDAETTRLEPGDPAGLWWAPRTIVPLTAVTTIHFRSAAELDEHRLREHENVRQDVPCAVTPELFENGAPGLQAWLTGLPPADGPASERFAEADRLGGGLTLIASVIPGEVFWLEGYVGLLGDERPKREKKSKAFPEWICDLFSAPARPADDINSLFASAAMTALRGFSPSGRWRPVDVVEQVRSTLDGNLSGRKRQDLNKTLDAMAEILRNERDFDGFRPGRGFPAQKALLLVLLRPQPDRLLAWDPADTGADDEIRVGAAFFSGVLTGRKQLPVELRPATLDAIIARREIELVAPEDPLTTTEEIDISVKPDTDAGTVGLWAGDEEVLSRRVIEVPLIDQLRDADLENDRQMRERAIHICREAGWADCIETIVRVPEPEQVRITARNGLEIHVSGFADTELLLLRARFLERIDTEGLPGTAA